MSNKTFQNKALDIQTNCLKSLQFYHSNNEIQILIVKYF